MNWTTGVAPLARYSCQCRMLPDTSMRVGRLTASTLQKRCARISGARYLNFENFIPTITNCHCRSYGSLPVIKKKISLLKYVLPVYNNLKAYLIRLYVGLNLKYNTFVVANRDCGPNFGICKQQVV